jgi:phage FluMu protein gp41
LIMETAEGLLVQCYGLNIDGPFSKRQIVKVLKEEQSDIRLTYKLK